MDPMKERDGMGRANESETSVCVAADFSSWMTRLAPVQLQLRWPGQSRHPTRTRSQGDECLSPCALAPEVWCPRLPQEQEQEQEQEEPPSRRHLETPWRARSIRTISDQRQNDPDHHNHH